MNFQVYSFVCVFGEDEDYLAYVIDLFEDRQGLKMVEVRWFVLHNDIQQKIRTVDMPIVEVSITSNAQKNSAESINCLATVLTLKHFEQCLEIFPKSLTLKTFICREWNVIQLPGFSTQPALTSLISHVQKSSKGKGSDEYLKSDSPDKPCKALSNNDEIELLCQDSGLRGCWYRCKILNTSASGKHLKVQYHDVTVVDEPNKLEVCIYA